MEIAITVVMLGVLTAFALPNYFQAMERQRERTAEVQLQTLHSANLLYHTQMNNTYLTGNWTNTSPVNDALRISLTPGNSMTFAYNGNAAAFTATLSWPGKTVRVSQIDLGLTNPCCVGGGCLTMGGC